MSKTALSRQPRRNSTDAERLIWSSLRNRGLAGAKFRRQPPMGPYVVDFFCLEHRLIVELDGGQHAVQVKRDERRDRWLEKQGYRVLRFWNHEVMSNRNGVLENIKDALGGNDEEDQ